MVSLEEVRSNYDELVNRIESQRDELRLQMHLASMETHDEWEKLESKWEHYRYKGQQLASASGESVKDIGDAITKLGNELKQGYENIKKSMR